MPKWSNRAATFELLLIAIVAITVAILELYIDTFERLVVWMAENEALLITEILTFAIVLAVGLAIYAWRRWRESIALEDEKGRLERRVGREQDATRAMRTYADAVTRGQEAERHRVARELHDDTIQRLIVLNQHVELAAFDYADGPVAGELQTIETLLNGIIGNVRRVIRELRPTYLDELGLVPALRTLVKDTREQGDELIEFDVMGTEVRLTETVEIALYRITQTALANIRQHAEASQAGVVIAFSPNYIRLSIEDDGKGFDIPDQQALARGDHFGLLGMQERAELIGAEFKIESAVGDGTRIFLKLPR